MILQPEILLHPNIPKPLHGVAPRIIKGENWWNEVRQIAYKGKDYHCWTCGIHKTKAKYHKWLEAHEIYEINYLIGEVKFIDICALCHSCHNFIHSGRLYSLYRKNEISRDKIIDILEYGNSILINNNLELNPFSAKVYFEFFPNKKNEMLNKYGFYKHEQCLCEWNDWYMLIDDKKYKGKFKSFEEWNKYYNNI